MTLQEYADAIRKGDDPLAVLRVAVSEAESSALERAAQECLLDSTTFHAGFYFATSIRALIPPAAAPAAETRNDPCQRCGKLGGHPVDFRFDGILMGSWICPHCLAAQEKRIAELEALVAEANRQLAKLRARAAPPEEPPAP